MSVNGLKDEMPPYQAPDLLCVGGLGQTDAQLPQRGWYVASCGDWVNAEGKAGIRCRTEQERDEALAHIAARSKWKPQVFESWLCSVETIYP